MWPGAGGVSQVRHLPHLLPQHGQRRADPGGQEGELVSNSQEVEDMRETRCHTDCSRRSYRGLHSFYCERQPRLEPNDERPPMTAGHSQPRPWRTTMPTTQQRTQHKDLEQHKRETLNALIGEQV